MIFSDGQFGYLMFDTEQNIINDRNRSSSIRTCLNFLRHVIHNSHGRRFKLLVSKGRKYFNYSIVDRFITTNKFMNGRVPLSCMPLDHLAPFLANDSYDIQEIYEENSCFFVKIDFIQKTEIFLADECIVCYEVDKVGYQTPFSCNHSCLCVDCYYKLKQTICPLCRVH